MVRQWKGADSWDGGAAAGFGGALLAVWAVLLSLFLIMAIMFSCAGGASQDKASATSHTDTYGGAACGGACGSSCGG
ncbi:hypothetical protein Pfo_009724 [Paulownia fortunei]|nr:hypothetical protein Pfo_009724 [Paulownia fortunei]